jgi:hypothetical protein
MHFRRKLNAFKMIGKRAGVKGEKMGQKARVVPNYAACRNANVRRFTAIFIFMPHFVSLRAIGSYDEARREILP